MVEARGQFRLALKAPTPLGILEELFRQDLQCHRPVDAGVFRPIDLPHAARAERRKDLIGAEAGAGGKCHEGRLRFYPGRRLSGLPVLRAWEIRETTGNAASSSPRDG